MKYLAKSAGILSDADRFQAILDVQLFTMEQDIRLWVREDFVVTWRPGDPLYTDPRNMGSYELDEFGFEEEELSGYYGHCVRPMIEEFGDATDPRRMRCEDCDVSWRGTEPCWMCGEEKKPRFSFYQDFFHDAHRPIGVISHFSMDRGGFVTANLEAFVAEERLFVERQMRVFDRAMEGASQSMQLFARQMGFSGVQSHYSVIDEWHTANRALQVADLSRPWPYLPPTPPPNPFKRKEVEIVLVEPVVPNLPEPEYTIHLDLPANWAELRNPVPLPDMPEPRDFSKTEIPPFAIIATQERRPRR